jgi:hypothetical protein
MVTRVAKLIAAIAGLVLILGFAANQAQGAVVISAGLTPAAWHGHYYGPRGFSGGVVVAPPYPYYAPPYYPYYAPGYYYPPGPGVVVVPRYRGRVFVNPPAFGFGFRW